MPIEKITEEEIEFMEGWYNPLCLVETLFTNFDDLGDFEEKNLGNIRLYQRPMLSHEALIDYDATGEYYNMNAKEKFQMRKKVGDIYNIGGRKYGKCEYINNKCQMADGSLKTFGELIGKTEKVISLNEKTWKFESSEATFEDNGLQVCYKVDLYCGDNIIVTSNHPLLTQNGWKQVKDLNTEDWLATPEIIPIKGTKNTNANLAKLLGYLLGDGSCSRLSSIGFTNINKELINEYKVIANYFNCSLRQSGMTYYAKKKSYKKAYYKKGVGNIKGEKLHLNEISKIVKKYHIDTLSKLKAIPQEVFIWKNDYIALLLNRLYACDSHINLHNYSIELTLASEEMIRQVHSLLLRFGIQSNIYFKKVKQFNAWRLIVAKDFDKFLNVIGIKGKDNGFRRKKKYSNGELIPNQLIKNNYNLFEGYKKYYNTRKMLKYNPSKITLQKVAKVVNKSQIDKIAFSDISWKKIKNITVMKPLDTVMVSVPKNNNYISNNIVSHNSLITMKLDISLSSLYDDKLGTAMYSVDEKKLRGILDSVASAFQFHPIFKFFDYKCAYKPEINFKNRSNSWKIQGVNMRLQGKAPGEQFYSLHVHKLWGDEVSFETEEVYAKRKESLSEFGAVIRLGGMTNFTRHSPIGKIFYNLDNKNKILNLPQFVNPYWDLKEKEDRVKHYGGEDSPNYRVFVGGEVLEDGVSEFDMERVKKCYKEKKEIKHFEIPKDRFEFFKETIVVDRPSNADRLFLCADIGDGKGGSEIIVLSEVGEKYNYLYSISLYNLKYSEQLEIFHYLIEKLNVNIIALECGEALGRTIADALELAYTLERVVRYAGNTKINVGFVKDNKGKIILKNGVPVYRTEFMSEWSVERLKTLFYELRMNIPTDHKFDNQINGVISTKSGTRKIYACISETGDHLFDAFKVFAIAQWLKKGFNDTLPVNMDFGTGVSNWQKKE